MPATPNLIGVAKDAGVSVVTVLASALGRRWPFV